MGQCGTWVIRAGSLFSSRFTYVTTNDGVAGIRATAVGPDDGRTPLYQCSVSESSQRSRLHLIHDM